ncbi:hypothetical protein FGRMN_4776 [Fusarium graminum]|nr:hypothetical protein FGRMN_4776 [Fusarium graminum]
MDSAKADGSCDNPGSPHTRSTIGSQASVSGQFVLGSNISASPQTHTLELSHQPPVSSPNHYSSTPYLNTPTTDSSYLPTSTSQSFPRFTSLASPGIDSIWGQPDQTQEEPKLSLPHLQQGQHQLTSNSRQSGRSTSMSTVAIQFDPAFSMGPRSAFTWPGPLDSSVSGSGLLSPGLSSMGHVSGNSLTPPPRSVTSSPPRLSLSVDQREVKRQSDRVRRDSRLVNRMRRANSNSYAESQSSPMMLSSATAALNIPAYSTATTPVTLMSDGPTTLSTSTYLQPYSPASLEDQQPHSTSVYPTYPQSLQANYNMPVDYASVYAGSNQYSSRSPPAHAGQDVGFMYQVPAVMGAGNGQEAGHVRVVQSRPKPRCWEHGCNGRQFSTFSNLLRHQREKSGQAAKASCPNCGAEFTRTTARNGHLLHDKCKGRRNS